MPSAVSEALGGDLSQSLGIMHAPLVLQGLSPDALFGMILKGNHSICFLSSAVGV